MLVLSRKPGEQIIINDNIRITVVEVCGNRVKIGIEAPKDVGIFRSELRDLVATTPPEPQPATSPRLNRLPQHRARLGPRLAAATVEG